MGRRVPARPRRSPPGRGAHLGARGPAPKVGASRAVDFLEEEEKTRGTRELAEEEGKREVWGLCLPWRKRKETWKEETAGGEGLLKKMREPASTGRRLPD